MILTRRFTKLRFQNKSFQQILRRQVWKNHGPADSGLGHSWPSRLGRVKTKKQREHGVDILDDNEDKIKAEGTFLPYLYSYDFLVF